MTDPPYNTRAERISGLGKVKHGPFVAGSGELTDSAFVFDFLRPALRHIQRFTRPGAIGFIFCDWRMDPLLREAATGVFAEMKNFITWGKTNAGMGSFYRSQTEFAQAWKISPGPTINNFELGQGGRHRSNLWIYPGANTFRRGRTDDLADHPSVKPLSSSPTSCLIALAAMGSCWTPSWAPAPCWLPPRARAAAATASNARS